MQVAATHRVIVTGTNDAGKSIVTEDVQAKMNGPGNFDFWQTKAGFSPRDLSIGRSPMIERMLSWTVFQCAGGPVSYSSVAFSPTTRYGAT